MANNDHVAQLKKGVDAWNAWRNQNPGIIHPDLSEADLYGADLERADLQRAHLYKGLTSRGLGQFDCGGLLGLENGRAGEHSRRMAKAPDKIRFDPLPHKVGEDWYVLAKYPDRQQEHITGLRA